MIEKNIFQSWHTHELHPAVKAKIDSMKELNPEYTYHLYTDEDMYNFVNTHFQGDVANCYNQLNIIVAKVDFWRYLVLYKYGGVYLDMDASIERPLRELIRDEDEAIITAEGNPDLYVQWALIFSKEHPILSKTIELIVDNIRNNRFPNDILKMTGPSVYTRAVNEYHAEITNGGTLKHNYMNDYTDITFMPPANKSHDTRIEYPKSYRLYGIDYKGYFLCKSNVWEFLYIDKTHWRQEVTEKELLISFD